MSCLRRFFGVFFRPATTFRFLAGRPVWVDALAIVLAAGAAFSYCVFPFAQQDRLRTFKESSAGFIEKHGEQQYAVATARIEDKSRALDAFVIKPLVALTGYLFASLIALGAGRAAGHDGNYLQVFSCLIHASFVTTILGNAVRLALVTARRTTLRASAGLAVFFPGLPAISTVYAALSQVDFFSLWMYGLFGLGLASAFKVSAGKGLAVAYALWVLRCLAGFAFAIVGQGFLL